MAAPSFYFVSLGCAKNSVDSSSMSHLLQDDGYQEVSKPGKADYLIVNTCGFIQPAREESLQILRKLSQKKKKGQKLIAAGCLTERYREQILSFVPGIDGIIGTRRWMDILELVKSLNPESRTPRYHLPKVPTIGMDEKGLLRASIQGGSAYLKIADGCRRPCAFCAIPLIKGTTVSRPLDAILRDAAALQETGVKELILIAQDTTDYGSDLGMKEGLATLLEKMVVAAPHIPWLRILYSYPGYVTDHLIDVITKNDQILHYLDIPLQHAHPEILRAMNRPSNIDWVYSTLTKMRNAMPDLSIRTTFIVGYPGETDTHFRSLLQFIREIKFDRVGAFKFSFEAGTPSAPLGDPVSNAVKEERLAELMKIQEEISLSKNQHWIGKKLQILVEGVSESLVVGRSFRDAPEIDGLVIAEGEGMIGQLLDVMITGAMTHDLSAQVIKN
jgi:ribosomal protein S12 methylthiotransferase